MKNLSVGIPGFEPGTPCSQSRCANRTALHPESVILKVVGIPGFEPGTPCSQSRCANRTALHPESKFRASCRIRTNDPEITNHVLWPTELKRRVGSLLYRAATTCYLCCGQALEDSQGAGRIGLPISFLRVQRYAFFPNLQYFHPTFFIFRLKNTFFTLFCTYY